MLSGSTPRSWTAERSPRRRRVDQDPVREHLERGAEPLEPAVDAVPVAVGEAQLDHLALDVLLDERTRRALGHDLALIHDHEPVAELLGLVHVVRREHERHALLLQPVEAVPERVACLRVEPRRRLVEQHQVGIVDERPRDRQPALHAAGEMLDAALLADRRSCTNSSSSVGPLANLARGDARSTCRRRGGSRRRRAPGRGCRPAARRRAAARIARPAGSGSSPKTVSSPPPRGETAPIMRIVELLPAPFGPRKPNVSPGRTAKSIPSTAVVSPKRLTRPRATIGSVAALTDRG